MLRWQHRDRRMFNLKNQRFEVLRVWIGCISANIQILSWRRVLTIFNLINIVAWVIQNSENLLIVDQQQISQSLPRHIFLLKLLEINFGVTIQRNELSFFISEPLLVYGYLITAIIYVKVENIEDFKAFKGRLSWNLGPNVCHTTFNKSSPFLKFDRSILYRSHSSISNLGQFVGNIVLFHVILVPYLIPSLTNRRRIYCWNVTNKRSKPFLDNSILDPNFMVSPASHHRPHLSLL